MAFGLLPLDLQSLGRYYRSKAFLLTTIFSKICQTQVILFIMNINYKQSQFELFPGTPGSSSEASRPKYLFAHLTLSLENMVVLAIMIVLGVVFSFSLGVEKGRKMANAVIAEISPIPKTVTNEKNGIDNRVASKTEIVSPQKIAPQVKPVPPTKPATQAKPAPSKPNPPPIQPSKQSYTIQVASYKDEEHANKEVSLLKKKGFDAFVAEKGDYVIVCVGKFGKLDEMNILMAKLKKRYGDCLARRL